MASYWHNQNETQITIPSVEEINNVTFYKIKVNVGEVEWYLIHRYSEFNDLHNHLVTDHGVSKDILPAKKVIGNKCPIFIANRRQALEEYCQKILNYFKLTMPRIFLEFFHFHIYDIFYLLQDLAMKYFLKADTLLSLGQSHTLTPLEVSTRSFLGTTSCDWHRFFFFFFKLGFFFNPSFMQSVSVSKNHFQQLRILIVNMILHMFWIFIRN